MDICLIGYGKMGHEVERVAIARGHNIIGRIDEEWEVLPACDVAIEFTSPSMAYHNIEEAVKQGVPIVSGTTGWLKEWDAIEKVVREHEGTLFYASNFSVGVYLFREVNKVLAKLMNAYPNYEPSVEETHHIQKVDYPSGTAISIADDMLEALDGKSESLAYLSTSEVPSHSVEQLLIKSIREGEVPGTHTVRYESNEDIITISHIAKGRAGLALGAVLAAEFVWDKKGIYGMGDIIHAKN